MSGDVTQIDLIRHGEPLGGVKIRGWIDDPLSEIGWEQMWASVGAECHWDRIISSPLSRCVEFARELGERHQLEVTEEARLREIGFGAWEGADPEALHNSDPQAVANFWADPPAYPPPGGEPFEQFRARVGAALDDLLDTSPGQRTLVVAHGGVNRMLIAQVLGMPLSHLFRMEIPYAAVSRIRIEQGIPRLVFHCGSLEC